MPIPLRGGALIVLLLATSHRGGRAEVVSALQRSSGRERGASAPCTYVASTTGTGTECSVARPCALAAGLGKLTPGDTLCLRGGTYAESLSWSESSGPTGTDERRRVVIRAYPHETATFMPTIHAERTRPAGVITFRCHTAGVPLATTGPCRFGRCSEACPRYITIGSDPADGSRIVLDARNASGTSAAGVWVQPSWNPGDAPPTGPHHVRLQGLEIKNSPTHGIFWGAGDYNEFIDLDVHGNGAPRISMHLHGLYLTSMNNTVLRGKFHHNRESGLHVWNGGDHREASYNTIDGVEVYGNGCSTGRVGGSACTATDGAPAITVGTGRHNVFRNVNVHDNARGGGFWLASGAWYDTIQRCTIRDNATASRWRTSGIYLGDESYATDVVTGAFEPALQGLENLPSWAGSFETTIDGNVLSGNASIGAWKGRTGLCSNQIYVENTTKNPLAKITRNVCAR